MPKTKKLAHRNSAHRLELAQAGRTLEVVRCLRKANRQRDEARARVELLSNLVYADEIKRQPGLIVQSLLR